MEKCVVDLFCAVTQIERRYYSARGTRVNGEQYDQETESSFSAELFHRFKNLIEAPINSAYYTNLILHYDITKAAINGRPDLVLHQAQENRVVQKMFIEIKTDSNVDLTTDFEKLRIATDNYLHFDNAVIVIANRPFQQMKDLITQRFQDLPFERRRKLFLINAELQQGNSIDYNLFQFSSIRIQQ